MMEVSAPKPHSRRFSVRRFFCQHALLGYLLVLPLVLIMVGLLAYPVISAVALSFQDKVLGTPGEFVGLDNYKELFFQDVRFRSVVRNSLVFTFLSIAGKLVAGMTMA